MDKQSLMLFGSSYSSEPKLIFAKNAPSSSLFFSNHHRQRRLAICGSLLFLFLMSSVTFGSLIYFLYSRPLPLPGSQFHFTEQHNHAGPASLSLPSRPLPNCLIIGARKCGTRALLDFMNIHPEIRVAPEEVHFFDDDDNYSHGVEWYRRQMPTVRPRIPGKSDHFRIVAEKSPSYLIDVSTPERVQHMNSSMRLLLILRNPVTRIVSDYAQMVENRELRGRPFKSLEETVFNRKTGHVNQRSRLIQVSRYHNHLTNWFHHFPPSQFHIVDGDRLIQKPVETIRKVEAFLGLQPRVGEADFVFNATKGFYCIRSPVGLTSSQQKLQATADVEKTLLKSGDEVAVSTPYCLGERKGRKHPFVNPQTLKKLRQYFQPHNQRLFAMIGRSFDW